MQETCLLPNGKQKRPFRCVTQTEVEVISRRKMWNFQSKLAFKYMQRILDKYKPISKFNVVRS